MYTYGHTRSLNDALPIAAFRSIELARLSCDIGSRTDAETRRARLSEGRRRCCQADGRAAPRHPPQDRRSQASDRVRTGGAGRNGKAASAPFLIPSPAYFSIVRSNARNCAGLTGFPRSEEHTSELQSLLRLSYAV